MNERVPFHERDLCWRFDPEIRRQNDEALDRARKERRAVVLAEWAAKRAARKRREIAAIDERIAALQARRAALYSKALDKHPMAVNI